jgi:hypothetical protein
MRKTKVMEVKAVELSSAGVTGKVRIDAAGQVNTSGWTDAELIDSEGAAADGNRHFDLVATAPTGIVQQVILPIAASRTIHTGGGTVCVVVHASANEMGPKCITVQIGDLP